MAILRRRFRIREREIKKKKMYTANQAESSQQKGTNVNGKQREENVDITASVKATLRQPI